MSIAAAPVISEAEISRCRPDCYKLDLASIQGIPGQDVIWARGLPEKDAPESSGKLIADAINRLLFKKEENP